jgi:hypothetical protein
MYLQHKIYAIDFLQDHFSNLDSTSLQRLKWHLLYTEMCNDLERQVTDSS